MAFLILILFQGSSLPQAHKSEIFQTYAEERLLGSTPTSTIQEDINRYGAVIRPVNFDLRTWLIFAYYYKFQLPLDVLSEGSRVLRSTSMWSHSALW